MPSLYDQYVFEFEFIQVAVLVVDAIKELPSELLKNAYPALQVAVNLLSSRVEEKSEVICWPSGVGQFSAKYKSRHKSLIIKYELKCYYYLI